MHFGMVHICFGDTAQVPSCLSIASVLDTAIILCDSIDLLSVKNFVLTGIPGLN